jgi:ATP-dependent RNA helicase RhlE
MERGNIDFRALTTLVLDEADRMLDMGFLPDIKRILSALPDGRQTMLFSATFAKDIELLTKQFMYKPKRIEIGRVEPTNTVRQEMYAVDQQKKPLLLQKILRGENVKSTIVFMRTKHRTDRITKTLKNEGFKVQAIHGGRTQGQRKNALDGFRKGQVDILVATDVAARGIDIQGVTHVINFDIPGAYDDYVHRIGRTARAEAEGDAITFVTKEDAKELRAIEKALGKPIPRVDWVGKIEIEKPDRPKKNTKPNSNGARDEEAKPSRRSKSRTERFNRSKNRANGSGRNNATADSDSSPRKPKRKKTQTTPKRSNKPSNSKSNKNDSNSTHKPTRGKASRRGPAKQSRRTANV